MSKSVGHVELVATAEVYSAISGRPLWLSPSTPAVLFIRAALRADPGCTAGCSSTRARRAAVAGHRRATASMSSSREQARGRPKACGALRGAVRGEGARADVELAAARPSLWPWPRWRRRSPSGTRARPNAAGQPWLPVADRSSPRLQGRGRARLSRLDRRRHLRSSKFVSSASQGGVFNLACRSPGLFEAAARQNSLLVARRIWKPPARSFGEVAPSMPRRRESRAAQQEERIELLFALVPRSSVDGTARNSRAKLPSGSASAWATNPNSAETADLGVPVGSKWSRSNPGARGPTTTGLKVGVLWSP